MILKLRGLDMEHIDIILGHIQFTFWGQLNRQEIINYFPNHDSTQNQIDKIVYIEGIDKISTTLNLIKFDAETKNYLGTQYYRGIFSNRKYVMCQNSDFGDHIYIAEKDRYSVFAIETTSRTRWAIRLCREIFLYEYLQKGFIPLHASAFKYENKTILAFGNKRRGKTTTMCAFVNNGASIVSNDLVLIGKDDSGKFIVFGWPWKITIGNAIAEKAGIKPNISEPKVELLPKEFCEFFKCNWAWQGYLTTIIHPKLNLIDPFQIKRMSTYELASILKTEGIEYPCINNIFTGQEIPINYHAVISMLSKSYMAYEISGDIWENNKLIQKCLEAE